MKLYNIIIYFELGDPLPIVIKSDKSLGTVLKVVGDVAEEHSSMLVTEIKINEVKVIKV